MMLLLTGCMSLDGFFFNGKAVDDYSLGGDVIPSDCVQLESYPASDPGTTLFAVWAHQPTTDACEPDTFHPTAQRLLYFHGNADNIDEYWARVEFYWEMGYEVFIWDYRGYGRSEGRSTHDNVLADGQTTIDHVAEVSGTEVSEMAFLGLSLGGFVSIHNVPERPPKRFVTEDMFANVQKMLDDGTDLDMPAGWMLEEEWDNVAAAAALPPEVPYLVIHGAADDYIQPEHAQLVYDAAASEVKDLWYVANSGHADALDVDPEGYESHLRCWIEEPDPSTCVGL